METVLKYFLDRRYTVEEIAEKLGCKPDTVRENIKRDKSSRYYLKAHQNANNGPYFIYGSDFADFCQRTERGKEMAA